MKCHKCDSEWKTTNQSLKMDRCPFCGELLIEDSVVENDSTVGEVIKIIVDRFGIDIILDKNKFLSVFSDFAPNMKKEKKVLSIALEENIGSIIVGTSSGEVGSTIQRIRRTLDMLLADAAIEIVIKAFSEALEWTLSPSNLDDAHILHTKEELIEEEILITSESGRLYPPINKSQHALSQGYLLSNNEFIEKLERCFLPLYSDMYFLLDVCVADDPMINSEWMKKTLEVAKKTYAFDLSDEEHIFILKQSAKGEIILAISKSRIQMEQELRKGFILSDKYLYIDDQKSPLKIKISDIVSFDIMYESGSKQYILSVLIRTHTLQIKRYLLRSDSKICTLKDSLNLFLDKHKKYVNKIKR